MAVTYEPIATTTLGSNQSSVTFSSITGTYTDLILVANATSTDTASYETLQARFNSDSGTNYSLTLLSGNGTAASSSRVSNDTYLSLGITGRGTSNNSAISIAHIQNYSNTTTNKTVIFRGNEAADRVWAGVSLWRSTSAITSITLYAQGGAYNLRSGSTFTLYGIKAA